MQADLICVGNELLTGLIENSNTGFLARRLWSAGIEVRESTVVADDWEAIRSALYRGLDKSEIIILTGGLGPTDDDMTREAVGSILGLQLVLNREWLEKLQNMFSSRGIRMPENNRKQAMIIEGATLLENQNGTAPGSVVEKDGSLIIMLPGPPNEMGMMFDQSVLPLLTEYKGSKVSSVKTLKCCGIGESRLEEKIKSLGAWDLPPISYVAKGFEVHLQIKGKGNAEDAFASIEKAEKQLKSVLGDHIYGSDDDTLAGRVAELMIDNQMTLALAESCSGGLLSDMVTDIPGSSKFYKGGLVAYSGEVKTGKLGLDKDLLELEGEVSETTAKAMAEAAKAYFNSDMAVGITGIAGPGSNSSNKPAGLVYVAVSSNSGCQCKKLNLGGGRRIVKERSAQLALDMVRRIMLSVRL